MAWTAPSTYSVSQVVTAALLNTDIRDNLAYLKGQAGTITLESDILYQPITVGIQTLGSLRNQSNNAGAYGFLRVGNDAGTNAGLFRNSSAATAYAGANSLTLYTGSAHPLGFATNDTLRMIVTGAGDVGIGTAAPRNRLHVAGPSGGGLLFYPYSGLGASTVTVLLAGSVTAGFTLSYTTLPSSGSVNGSTVFLSTPGGVANIYTDGATNQFIITYVADGSVTLTRAGSRTYSGSLLLTYF